MIEYGMAADLLSERGFGKPAELLRRIYDTSWDAFCGVGGQYKDEKPWIYNGWKVATDSRWAIRFPTDEKDNVEYEPYLKAENLFKGYYVDYSVPLVLPDPDEEGTVSLPEDGRRFAHERIKTICDLLPDVKYQPNYHEDELDSLPLHFTWAEIGQGMLMPLERKET